MTYDKYNKMCRPQFKIFKRIILVFILSLSYSVCFAQSDIYNGKKLLIYTKNGEGYIHDNISKSTQVLKAICEDLGIESVVSNDPNIFLDQEIMSFNAIIFTNTNNEAFDTSEQRAAFQKFCLMGKGFGGIHSAIGSERDWPWFWELIGGTFLRHPPFQTFRVTVADRSHPSTAHFNDYFEVLDECYFMKNLNPDIKVLLEADLSTVDEKDNKAYRPIKAPLSWHNTEHGGKQWYTALGHSADMYDNEWFQQHLRGGIIYLLK